MTHGLMRVCWAAVGAAVAVTLGAGGLLTAYAVTATGTPSGYEPLTPARILDTRNGTGTGGVVAPVGPDKQIALQVTGAGGVPADANSVVLNLTATAGTAPSFVTVWPDGEPRPTASVLNVQPGVDTPNMITVKLGANGKVDIYNFAGSVHVVADVAGYFHPVADPVTTSWGAFDANGTLIGGNIDINMPRQSAGFYRATLGGNFPQCSYTVSLNATGTNLTATVQRGTFPTWIDVNTYAGGVATDEPFTLVRYCPPT
jgi:hypothetical protein